MSEAVSEGASACIDPALFPAAAENSPYLAPQVLTHVNHNMSVMTEESFGPVVGIMPVTLGSRLHFGHRIKHARSNSANNSRAARYL